MIDRLTELDGVAATLQTRLPLGDAAVVTQLSDREVSDGTDTDGIDTESVDPGGVDGARHRLWMRRAIALAHQAGEAGDVPVGAIIIGPDERPLAVAANRKQRDHDPTAHAEILALQMASHHLGNWHLNDCTLYVTLEPCPMCAGALIQSRLGRLVYGASDPKTGAVRTVLNIPDSAASNHRLVVVREVLEPACRIQLQQWFQARRRSKQMDSTSASDP